MRIVYLLAILLALDLYAFQAIRLLTQPWSEQQRITVAAIYWAIVAGGLTFFWMDQAGLTEQWSDNARLYVRACIIIIYLGKACAAFILLVDDFRRGVFWFLDQLQEEAERDVSRSRFLSQLALIIGGIPIATLTYGMVRNPYRYRYFEETIGIANLPQALDGLRIIQISDIHSGSWTRKDRVAQAIDMINAREADLIFFTGDIVNNRTDEMYPYIDLFRRLEARFGVFSVLGNHDYGDYEQWPTARAKEENLAAMIELHRQLGWKLLQNEHQMIDLDNARLAVLGVENWSAIKRFPRKGDLAAAYRGTEEANVRILLSHDPTHWEAQVVPNFPSIDLTLSGHTHGMQFGVEIPGFRWSPAQYLYKQWAGLYQEGSQWLYVNRGLGFLGYPGRVGILPEITLLTLRNEAGSMM